MATAQPHAHGVRVLLLWFGVLGGPIAWVGHLAISYELVSLACVTGLTILFHLTTIVTALVALAAAIVSFLAWQISGAEAETDVGGIRGRTAFMALAGIYMGLLFFGIILVESMGNYFLCAFQNLGGRLPSGTDNLVVPHNDSFCGCGTRVKPHCYTFLSFTGE